MLAWKFVRETEYVDVTHRTIGVPLTIYTFSSRATQATCLFKLQRQYLKGLGADPRAFAAKHGSTVKAWSHRILAFECLLR